MITKHRRPRQEKPSQSRWVTVIAGIVALLLLQLYQQKQRQSGIPDEPVVARPRLVDGDSFHFGSDEVRLHGIDAPEGRQTCTRAGQSWPCGEESRRHLARLIGNRSISCRTTERDQHDRLLSVCSVDGIELNREMVVSGMALAYGNYEREEREARAAKRGLWSGEFQRPREWRRQHQSGRE